MKGMSNGTRSGTMNFCTKRTKALRSAPPRPVVGLTPGSIALTCSLTGECHCRSQKGLFGSRVGIEARLVGAAWFPFAARTSLCGDIATTSETRMHGWLTFGVFCGGDDEDHVSTIRKMRHERFGQHEGPKVICGVR